MPRAKEIILALMMLTLWPMAVHAAEPGAQTWQTETLPNGLRVIYAPMPASPTTHVRVVYHVGSRDERPDRQGFAHMFEHMMFRGSAHVPPEEHSKLIGQMGGISNAFTSFDQTVYWQTLPASYTDLALWLEADRMASFKVSADIFVTERQVVAEEWRMRRNQPYGTMFEDLLPVMYQVHPYRWAPIGDMQHLQAAKTPELQDFFNHYYVPNNAILVIAGYIDLDKIKDHVHKYFGWIPGTNEIHKDSKDGGAHKISQGPISRSIPTEPSQTAPRRVDATMRVTLPRIILAYHMPPNASDDGEKLQLLLSILGDGRSSRLYRALVTTENPLCVSEEAIAWGLEDGGIMGTMATLLGGKDAAAVEKIMREQIALIRDKPVTSEELEKVKQQERLNLAQRFETAEKVAEQLGDEMRIHNNLDRVNTARARLEAMTPADLQRVAQKYLGENQVTTMVIHPGTPTASAAAATVPSATSQAADAVAGSVPAPNARAIVFPSDFPTQPPITGKLPAAVFEKGVESTIDLPALSKSIRLVVMEDHRMPIISWTLVLRTGGHATPPHKEGVGGLAAAMVRRGPKGKTFDQFNEELESQAISIEMADEGDNTRISGSSLKEQFPFALAAAKSCLLTPAFDPGEFQRLKNQSVDALRLQMSTPRDLVSRELTHALYGDSPLGRLSTPESMDGVTLDDVRTFFGRIYHSDDAVLMISGDITVPEAQRAAWAFVTGLPTGEFSKVEYAFPPAPTARRIVLIDLPQSRQSAIGMGTPSYSIASNEKFAGTLLGQILCLGNESRLGKYVRAEKGLVYGVFALFYPNRQAGTFLGQTDTKFETTGDTLEAMFKVFDDMKATQVPEKELADAKFRVAGRLLMSMETMRDQAGRRVDGMLNGYPADYYDKYAERVGKVTADDLQKLMKTYVEPDRMTIVVVAPADKVKAQLEKFGTVEVIKAPQE